MESYQWIANFGFSSVIAIYTLTRLEPLIREQTKAISLLTIVVARMSKQDLDKVREMGGD